jgi:peptide/nickel transport system substrate-binding protein
MLLYPAVEVHPALRILYSKIRNIEINKNDPKKFSVYTEMDYMLSDELVTNMEVFPEYFYDSLKVLRSFDLSDLRMKPISQEIENKVNKNVEFASKLNSAYFMRENVSGAGPYKLESWTTNNYIALKKKDKWWGDKYENLSYLSNNPSKIIFKVIPDKVTSFTELKSGNIDVLSGELGNDFVKMKNDQQYKDKFHFLSPLSTQYYAVIINNRNEIFKDKLIRKAVARLIDVDLLLKTFGTGGEMKAVSPIHPAKDYYDKSLKNIPFNIAEAGKLIKQAGWIDTNGDGSPDKIIGGKKTELKFSITITGKAFGKSLALQLKENAGKLGIEVEVVTRQGAKFKQDLDDLKFDLAPIVGSQDLTDIDPFPEWHSSNISKGGSNVSGFTNPQCDKIIENIISTHDRKKRGQLYIDFQKLIYEEQPVIFLFIPTNNIIINKKFDAKASVKRPGYFANTFKLRK